MSYRERTDSCQNRELLQVLVAAVTLGIGIWLLARFGIPPDELSIASIALGGVLGSAIGLMNYSERLERAYESSPNVFLWTMLAAVIVFVFTIEFYAGFLLGAGAGICCTLALVEGRQFSHKRL